MNRKTLILVSSVATIHLILFFFDFKGKKEAPAPKKSIIVNTYSPPPPPPPAPRPVAKKKAPIQRKTPRPSRKKDILKDLKETLSKIETTPPPQTSFSIPKQIPSLQIDQVEKEKATDYFISLAHSLKEGLELPEYGDVKLELTVSKTGRVIKLRILHADSEKNRRYLELNLSQMRLPPFSEDLKNENEHTFILTFCNAT